jgi:microcin C transport system substrate-binding protein
MSLSRRSLLRGSAAALALPALGKLAAAQAQTAAQAEWKHGLSLFGEIKYPPDFTHFEYVNPKAPQGGVVREIAFGTFDNFNAVVSGVKGTLAMGTELFMQTLMTPALDEVSTEYGLIAEAVSHPDDHSWVKYRLRANARWHDGKPITADDVIWSIETWKAHSPQLAAYYRHVVKAEKSGEREVTFAFDRGGNRELPQIVGQVFVLPKHWWEGTDKNGNKRDVAQTTLEPPLGCGPYRVKEVQPGRTIVYEKAPNYWGKDLNVSIGTNNFQNIRFDYYRDADVALQAFKADDVDWRTENIAKNWATAYDFPAARDGKVVREEFPIRNAGGMQAFAFNIRRDKFKDERVRRAFNFAFDFEEMNRQLFYGLYKRTDSYFAGTELASSGLPSGLELEILNSVRADIPPEVFTTPYKNPVNGTSEAVRNNLREALKLLHDAGYEVKNTKLINSRTGQPYQVEFLIGEPAFQRVVLFYKPPLDRLGMTVAVRLVDPAQYENRLRQWDFDIVVGSWGESLSPGNEQRGFWGSQAADQPGSRNLVGIKDKAIDALIERVIYAKNREELVAATHALDRVLLAHHYVMPQWYSGVQRTARWDRFSHPETMPKYGQAAFPTIWWWDKDKAAKVPQRS